ncbi:tRNA G37 N-methylase Trm5 [Rossellomorea marisflavi]
MDSQGQERFLSFILQRVQEGKEEEAKRILMENFKKQQEGTFSEEDALSFLPRITSLLKEEKISEVHAVVTQFSKTFNQRGDSR